MTNTTSLSDILVSLVQADEQVLFIMLGFDGAITRLGTVNNEPSETNMFVGRTTTDAFFMLRSMLNPELLTWFGQRFSDPDLRGDVCELTLGIRYVDGRESGSVFRYGSESSGPPQDITQFVVSAIRVTDPWLKQQTAKA
jgi:hypothetical protein